jgi:hypothetical protein
VWFGLYKSQWLEMFTKEINQSFGFIIMLKVEGLVSCKMSCDISTKNIMQHMINMMIHETYTNKPKNHFFKTRKQDNIIK